MGCGKSSTGRELAELLGAGFTDLDELVVRREGRSIPEIFREGEAAFRKAELEALRELLGRDSDGPEVIALGGGTLTSEAARSSRQRNWPSVPGSVRSSSTRSGWRSCTSSTT